MIGSKKIIGIALAIGIVIAFAVPADADVLEIRGKSEMKPEDIHGPDCSDFEHAVSQRNLLNLERDGKSLLPVQALSAAEPRHIRICAVRVQFQYEETDHDSTTGRGHFDFRTYEEFLAQEKHAVDPAPHNREYFEKHIEALNNYWHTVSNGKLTLSGDVYPVQSDSVYTLDESMSYYGAREPADGLGEFFSDALQLADIDDDINWIDYDVFIVFHAGSDRQNDLGFPPTPHDLFTGFLIMGSPIPVEDSSVLILEGMVMPETSSQDNRATALNAVIAHEFGHQLGLVDLYDTRTFTTFIGDYSLMDNNGFGTGVDLGFDLTRAVLGTMPIYPDAWSRAYLGFDEVITVDSGINIDVLAAELISGDNRIYKVPISENEYYLIENRQVDPDRDGGASLKADLDNTGVILGPAPNPDNVPPGQSAPLTREYDFLIPGSGLVIWHIDESVAWLDYDQDGVNNFRDNDLQWYYYQGIDEDLPPWDNRPFLKLVEADGIVDFGGEYWVNYGRPEDLFEANNNRHFGPQTNPSTRSHSGAYTGIDISDITRNDTIMYFDLRQEVKTIGWPHHSDSSKFPPALYDIDGNGYDEIFVSGKNHILGFKEDGDFILRPRAGFEVISERRSTPRGPLHEILHIDTLRSLARLSGQNYSTPPTIADLDNNGVAELALGTENGNVMIYSTGDANDNRQIDLIALANLGNARISASVVATQYDGLTPAMELVAGDTAGSVYVFDMNGNLLNQIDGIGSVYQFSISSLFNHAYALTYSVSGADTGWYVFDLNNPAEFVAIDGTATGISAGYADTTSTVWINVTTEEGMIYTFNGGPDNFGEVYPGGPNDIGQPIASSPVLFPIGNQSGGSQLYFAGDNMMHVLNMNGTPIANFPRQVDIHQPAGPVTTAPLIADVSGDGVPESILGTAAGELFMITSNGIVMVTSPIAAPGGISVSAALATETSSQSNRGQLYAVSDDGLIYSFTVPVYGNSDYNYYTQFEGGSHHRNFQEMPLSQTSTEEGLLAKYFNYPNPASEFTNIRFELNRDAEANIKIYDLSGRLVYEDDMPAVGGMANEYRWDLEGFPSGVYHCRLEVKSSMGSDIQMWNIAVVK